MIKEFFMNIKDFTRGMGSVLEIFPSNNRRDDYLDTPFISSDEDAIKQDWQTVGEDIKSVIAKQVNSAKLKATTK